MSMNYIQANLKEHNQPAQHETTHAKLSRARKARIRLRLRHRRRASVRVERKY
jgi:hypothetical protein